MLRINTFLDRSPIHGIGLFASQNIKTGTLVWEFNHAVDLAYSPEQWNSLKECLSSESFGNLLQRSYKEEGFIYICMDNAQFMNHSKTRSNVFHKGTSKRRMYALRDIPAGEELLCNYLSYSDPDDYHVRKIIQNIQ
jgi:SET domain-containing protein